MHEVFRRRAEKGARCVTAASNIVTAGHAASRGAVSQPALSSVPQACKAAKRGIGWKA